MSESPEIDCVPIDLSNNELATGDLIREARLSLGISQKELGDSCGINNVYISLFERGEKALDDEKAAKLAVALGIDKQILMDRQNVREETRQRVRIALPTTHEFIGRLTTGDLIWKARANLGLTQQQLASDCGTIAPYISMYENDRKILDDETAGRLAKALDHDKQFLLDSQVATKKTRRKAKRRRANVDATEQERDVLDVLYHEPRLKRELKRLVDACFHAGVEDSHYTPSGMGETVASHIATILTCGSIRELQERETQKAIDKWWKRMGASPEEMHQEIGCQDEFVEELLEQLIQNLKRSQILQKEQREKNRGMAERDRRIGKSWGQQIGCKKG